MSERVVFIGLDAVDPATALAMARRGEMPALRSLLSEGTRAKVQNPTGLYVGSLWPSFFTGWSASRTGFHCWEEIEPGSYTHRLTSPSSLRGTPFWERISDAGHRVAVIDVPHTRAATPLNGIQVSEWGCHDRHFGITTQPAELEDELLEQHGLHPALGVDPFEEREFAADDYLHRDGAQRTREELTLLCDSLRDGALAKSAFSTDLLSREPWHLFVSVLGEGHAVGHQAWHQHDATHPLHDRFLRARTGDPIAAVYRNLDIALGEHLRLAGPEATVMVLLSHGMGAHNDGTHLLPEILRRLDAAYCGALERGPLGRVVERLHAALPEKYRSRMRRLVARRLRRPGSRSWVDDTESEENRRSQFFFVAPNNFVVGGIRINVSGREPEGLVRRGEEFDDICDGLTADLLALVNVATGEPVVRSVTRSDSLYDRADLDALPDLFVEWNQDAPIETIWSPRTGELHRPYTHWRTGDHRPGGLLLAAGPGIAAGGRAREIDILDLAPTIAARLGVDLADADGQVVPWLAGGQRSKRAVGSVT